MYFVSHFWWGGDVHAHVLTNSKGGRTYKRTNKQTNERTYFYLQWNSGGGQKFWTYGRTNIHAALFL